MCGCFGENASICVVDASVYGLIWRKSGRSDCNYCRADRPLCVCVCVCVRGLEIRWWELRAAAGVIETASTG